MGLFFLVSWVLLTPLALFVTDITPTSQPNRRSGNDGMTRAMHAASQHDWKELLGWLAHPALKPRIQDRKNRTLLSHAIEGMASQERVFKNWRSQNKPDTSDYMARQEILMKEVCRVLASMNLAVSELTGYGLGEAPETLAFALDLGASPEMWNHAFQCVVGFNSLDAVQPLMRMLGKYPGLTLNPESQCQLWNKIAQGLKTDRRHESAYEKKYRWSEESCLKLCQWLIDEGHASQDAMDIFALNGDAGMVLRFINQGVSPYSPEFSRDRKPGQAKVHAFANLAGPVLRGRCGHVDLLDTLLTRALPALGKDKGPGAREWVNQAVNSLLPLVTGWTEADDDCLVEFKARRTRALALLTRIGTQVSLFDPEKPGRALEAFLNYSPVRKDAQGKRMIEDFEVIQALPGCPPIIPDDGRQVAFILFNHLRFHTRKDTGIKNFLKHHRINLDAAFDEGFWIHGDIKGSWGKDCHQQTLLMQLVRHGSDVNPEAVAMMLDHGVDAAWSNPEGQTALGFLLEREKPGSGEVLRLLLPHLPQTRMDDVLVCCAREKQEGHLEVLKDMGIFEPGEKGISHFIELVASCPLDEAKAVAFAHIAVAEQTRFQNTIQTVSPGAPQRRL
jgi:hypothetical protein